MRIMKKVALLVYISRETDRKLREFIALTYRRFEKGLLSHEVERAIQHWIAMHTNAQTQLTGKGPNPTPLVVQAYQSVKRYLMRNYYMELPPGSVVVEKHLREAIMATRGSDPRTVKKWLRTFTAFHLIKHLGGARWELAA